MAEFHTVDPKESGWHLVGLLPERQKALIFADYLNSISIKALAHPTLSDAWSVYVEKEQDISKAKLELLRFANNPFAREFNDASWKKGAKAPKDRVIKGRSLNAAELLRVTTLFEVLAVLVYLLGLLFGGFRDLCIYFLSFTSVGQVTSSFEIWRLITPVFLHFDVLHIAFNVVLLEALGRPMERVLGSMRMLVILLIVAVISNILQLGFTVMSNPYALFVFGGLSGVVYGIIGYLAVLSKAPGVPTGLRVPKGLMTVCLIFIVFGFFLSGIANFCHLGGMAAGALLGLADKKRYM